MDLQTLFFILCGLSLINQTGSQSVDIKWEKVVRTSRTTATLQVVVNPMLRRNSTIHDRAFKELKKLNADYVRYVPWLPYPRLAVAELQPPTSNSTSWDFSLIDPMMIDFMDAQKDRKVVINFSTIPQWMFKTPKPFTFPADPNQVDWSYEQGTEFRDPSLKELGDYYERLVSWYVNGSFTDELGKVHKSGHKFNIDYWEVLNEVEAEHKMTPQTYTAVYDAMVTSIKKVAPNMKFVGMALAYPTLDVNTWFPYFLNHSNHKAGIPLDMISYHFYATSKDKETIESMQHSFFKQADDFIATIPAIEKIRQKLSPTTQTSLNEIGSIADNAGPFGKDDAYWILSGAIYAYVFSHASSLGIEFVGESQLVGYPTQFPSVSMVNWETGTPNKRFLVLQLILNNFASGDKLVETSVNGTTNIHAQGFSTKSGERKLLIINKLLDPIEVTLSEKAKEISFIDVKTGDNIVNEKVDTNKIMIHGFAVIVVKF